MSEFLFDEFDEVSAKQWKQKIQVDLKGVDYNESLVWKSNDGIHVKPFYHADDFQETIKPIPGQPVSWRVGQSVFIDDENIANRIVLNVLDRGAEALFFTAEKEFEIDKVFNDFPFKKVDIYFNLKFLNEAFIQNLMVYLQANEAKVFYNIDIVGNLARTGNWFLNLSHDHKVLENILTSNSEENIIGIDISLYQNAGANRIQQLAYALAHANEYLNHFQDKNDIQLTFTLAINGNYFFEIAKIRALRKLYAVLAKEYGFGTTCHIICIPAKRNKTIYDYNINILRTTTECMSAALGGANVICNLPYDALYHKSNEFAERISRNQLLIMKSESYLNMVSNPSDGSYYIESLTTEMSEKALSLFKNIETNGGFLKQLKDGLIQRKIKENAKKEQGQFDDGDIVLLGTNKHPNPQDLMQDHLEIYPFVKIKSRKTLIEPIIEKRLSEKVEQKRLSDE